MKQHHNFKHGVDKNSRIYKAWCLIKERSFNPNNNSFKDYGAKGLILETDLARSFIAFRDYVGYPPDESCLWSIDRIDNNLGYVKGNMRWATPEQQARNKKMRKDNSSGVTGVNILWPEKYPMGVMVTANWTDLNGKRCNKKFSVKKMGLLPAFKAAVEARNFAIAHLNTLGADYSDKHGK